MVADKLSKSTAPFEPISYFDRIYVLYASQTGQAESISEFLRDNLAVSLSQPKAIERHCLSNYEALLESVFKVNSELTETLLAVFVVSTTGQGDSPDKVLKFFRWIRRLARSLNKESSAKPLGHLWYSLLGLGDTNYDNFANFGHVLNKLLLELGARPYFPPDYADDAVGLELVTEPFMTGLMERLKEHCEQVSNCEECFEVISLPLPPPLPISSSVRQKVQPKMSKEIRLNEIDEMKMLEDSISDLLFDDSLCYHLKRGCMSEVRDLGNNLCDYSPALAKLADSELTLPSVVFRNEKILLISDDGTSKYAANDELYKLKEDKDHNYNIELTLTGGEEEAKEVNVREFITTKAGLVSPICTGEVIVGKELTSRLVSKCYCEKIVFEAQVVYHDEKNESVSNFVPGDAYGIYSANTMVDIHQILQSVKIAGDFPVPNSFKSAQSFLELTALRKKFVIVDKNNKVDLLPYLIYCVELRSIPKKVALAHLALYTSDTGQRRRLLELSSRQGALDYQAYIFAPRASFCDILRMFPTCCPPLVVLLHYLTVAKPRYFSAASLPKPVLKQTNKMKFEIVLTLANDFRLGFNRGSESLLGLFSGKFYKHYKQSSDTPNNFDTEIAQFEEAFKSLERNNVPNKICTRQESNESFLHEPGTHFPVLTFLRVNKLFQLPCPSELSDPLILIATGTGIAPFLSFLEACANTPHRDREIYLFYGCRDPRLDLTHFEQLRDYSEGEKPLLRHLCICFSRADYDVCTRFERMSGFDLCGRPEEEKEKEKNKISLPKHVDNLLLHHAAQVMRLIFERKALIYACGNYRCLSKSVIDALAASVQKIMLKTPTSDDSKASPEAIEMIKKLIAEKRIVFDVWA